MLAPWQRWQRSPTSRPACADEWSAELCDLLSRSRCIPRTAHAPASLLAMSLAQVVAGAATSQHVAESFGSLVCCNRAQVALVDTREEAQAPPPDATKALVPAGRSTSQVQLRHCLSHMKFLKQPQDQVLGQYQVLGPPHSSVLLVTRSWTPNTSFRLYTRA